jgi:hypothetical protein
VWHKRREGQDQPGGASIGQQVLVVGFAENALDLILDKSQIDFAQVRLPQFIITNPIFRIDRLG